MFSVSVSRRWVLRSTALASPGSSRVLTSNTKCQVFHCRTHGELADRSTQNVFYTEKFSILIENFNVSK